jgi:hypothetical protein
MFKRFLSLAVRHAGDLHVKGGELYERPRFGHGGAAARTLLYKAVGHDHYFAVLFGVPPHGGPFHNSLNIK